MRRAAVVALLALAACDPGSRRPHLTPLPEARLFEMEGRVPEATARLAIDLRAEGLPVTDVSPRDGWLSTPWFDAETGVPIAGTPRPGLGTVRLRAWIDPGRPKHSEASVELVYLARYDASLPPREREGHAPDSLPLAQRVGRVLDDLRERPGIRAR